MQTRILTERDVHKILRMDECMDVMADALKTTSRGDAVNPLRSMLKLPDGSGLLGMMPAYLGAPRNVGIKVVTVTPGNHGTEYDAHQGAVLLFETEHGRLLAVIDATSITAIRTAAVSGVATRLLATKGASTLAILGSGVQAWTHLAAMLEARNLTAVRVWSPTRSNAERLAKRGTDKFGVEIEVSDSAQAAVTGADIICTTTSAREPILCGEWIGAGTHVNAVGACLRAFRELDTQAVAGARLFVDRRESALNESGDILIPIDEGAIDEDHILGEIGDVLLGRCEGRRSEEEITVFKSLGIGVEDLGAAAFINRKANEANVGVCVDFGGLRNETG